MKKTPKPRKKRPISAKSKAYLAKLDALTKKIHKASDTGEIKTVKVYSISLTRAKKAAVKQLSKKK